MNWRETWERKQRERAGMDITQEPVPEYWDKVAEDYSLWNKSNDYEYGRKAVEAIREIINPDFEALDIGAGTGTLAIPFAKVVGKMTAIEPSPVMLKYLLKNAEEERIKNLHVINKNWQEVADADTRKKFDIVACSHLLWQFADVDRQLKRMEAASMSYCCVVHPAGGADIMVKIIWPEATGEEYSGEVDPDLDDLVYVMLRQRGILVNVRAIDFTVRLSVEQEVRIIARLMSKHMKMIPIMEEIIRKRVSERSSNGVYETRSNAVVMWWKPPTSSRRD